jgi:protein TonB
MIYALHVVTLATWLSVAGMGVVGSSIPIWHLQPKSSRTGETAAFITPPDVLLGEARDPAGEAAPAAAPMVVEPEPLPAPPELPAITEFPALPELPELPTKPADAQPAAARPTPQHPARPGARTASPASGRGSALSTAERIAAGQMPPPPYPAEAKRKGQSGTVLVEFTVAADGHVIAAHATQPSPWPLLNNEALRAVRRWKFPPGPVVILVRPIDFKLH